MSIEARDLAFGYRGNLVGRGLDLSVPRGEVLCLLGPNGCGKTTLFKTLLGLLPPLDGNITLDGENMEHWSRQRRARFLAYVPQQHDAYFPFTVMEVVLMGRGARVPVFATPGRHDRKAAESTLEALHLWHLRDQVYSQISGGERQLTLIARALTQEPQVLVMDEPTTNLDFGNQVLVLNHILALKRKGITVLMSTHDPGQAFHCADKAALLRDGQVLHSGTCEAVLTSANLKSLYGVDVAVLDIKGTGHHTGRVCVPMHAGPAPPGADRGQAPWA